MTSARRRSEDGATLVEILVAVVVIGVGFVSILGGLGTSFALSAFHREQARAEAAVRAYAETIKDNGHENSCATNAYAAVAYDPPSGLKETPAEVVDYLDAATGGSIACSTTSPVLHVVRLTVSSESDSRAVETIDVVMRPPT